MDGDGLEKQNHRHQLLKNKINKKIKKRMELLGRLADREHPDQVSILGKSFMSSMMSSNLETVGFLQSRESNT